MRMLNEIRDWLSNARKQRAVYSVHCNETGLTQIVQQGDSAERTLIPWQDVRKVFAYKKDCFAVDQIRLVIEGADGNRRIEITEDDEGYKRLIEQMPIRIPGFPVGGESWEKAALAPFELRWTQIYTREP